MSDLMPLYLRHTGCLMAFCPRGVYLLISALLLSGCLNGPLTDSRQSPVVSAPQTTDLTRFAYDNTPLQTLLARAQPYVDSQQSIPGDLAIRIIAACNREQDWRSQPAVVEHTNTQLMNDALYAEYSLQLLNAWQHNNKHSAADQWLNSAEFLSRLPLLDADQQVLLSVARADNHQAMGRYLQSARERIFIEDFIVDKNTQRRNAQAIWQNLLSTPETTLQAAYKKNTDPSFKAWLELALIQYDQQPGDTDSNQQEAAWQQRWPQHNAEDLLATELSRLSQFSRDLPQTIALFLPLSGAMQPVGEALRDGVVAAYMTTSRTNRRSQPVLLFYDTNAEPIASLYDQATRAGAEMIIGPLQKDNVKALFTMPTSVPILALNVIEDSLPPPVNIVQFGLAAEDEAREIASAAALFGYQNPLLLVVDKDWARRAANSFQQAWQAAGNPAANEQLLSQSQYFSKEIEARLGLNGSEARRIALQNATRMRFEFVPRRRQDYDAVVLFCSSEEAKTIKPLLAYHYAGDLPVFASSQVYDAGDRSKNADLNGIIFNEMPWFLYSALAGQYQEADKLYTSKIQQRLFAMGIDAYNLHFRLEQLKQFPQSSWLANTGRLSVNNQRIARSLPLARMVSGKPELLEQPGS